MVKTCLALIVFLFLLSPFRVYGDETCTQGTDCLESINENTYNTQQDIETIKDSLGIGDSSPDVDFLTVSSFSDSVSDFNSSMSDSFQLFGIFAGLLLFGVAFYNLGLFLYNKR